MSEITIVGGGIGGLCTAIGLRQQGFEPTIYERAAELRHGRSGIWILPNGMAALDRLGIADEVEREGISLDGTELHSQAGRRLVSANLRATAQRLGLNHPMVSIRRAALLRILQSSLPDSDIRLGRQCTGVDPASSTITFADGTEQTAQLVIGADGIGSVVRTALFPDVSVRYTGAVAYRGLVETPLSERAYRVGTAVMGNTAQFGYSAVSDDCAWWYLSIPGDTPDDVPDMEPAELAEEYRGLPDPAPELMGETDPKRLVRTSLGDLPSLKTWHRNTVTLIGDAAHAMTPDLSQGSSQAMADAVVLSDAIAEEGTTRKALRDYESQRKASADAIRRQSWIQGRLGQLTNPLLIALRNTGLRYAPSTLLQRQTEEMFAVDF